MASELSTERSSQAGKQPALWRQIGLAFILLLGLGLRLIRLGADSIWYDEAVSLFLASKSLTDMIVHTAGDIHPPLYYALLHFWTGVMGSSEFAAGLFSLLFGMLLIPLTYYLAREILNPNAGLLAGFLVAISPYNIWYSQEIRMYTLAACLGMAALLGLRSVLRPGSRRWMGWIVYALAAAAGMYVLYYFAFLLIAINVWAIVVIAHMTSRNRRQLLGRWAGAQVGAIILYAPWTPIVVRQVTNPPVPPWRSFTPLHVVLAEAWTALSFGQSVEPAQVWPLLIVTLLLTAAGVWGLWRKDWTDVLLLLGYWLIPLALILLLSLWTPLYHVRYLFAYSPAFYLLLAAGVLAALKRWRIVGPLAMIALVIGSGFSLWQYHVKPEYRPDDHRGAVNYLNDYWQPRDAVLINAGYVYPAVVYYNDLPVAWRGRLGDYGTAFARDQHPDDLAMLQTGSIDAPPDLGWGSPTSDFYPISQDETAAALERVFADYDRVWVYRCYDTVTDPDGFIRSWLDAHGAKFDEPPAFAGQSFIRVQGYLTGREASPPQEAEHAGITFGDQLELSAMEDIPDALIGSRPLNIVLWWRPVKSPLPRLAVTARLVDEAGHVWAQTDERPLGAEYDTSQWPAGEFTRHPLALDVPLGLVPGAYHLIVGLYEVESGTPWLANSEEPLPAIAVMTASGDTVTHLNDKPLATFEGRIDLVDATVEHEQIEAGRNIGIDLTWHANETPGEDLIAFVQLLDESGTLAAAQESPPADGRFPTALWTNGQVVRDHRELHVPADLPAGEYQLIVGWYHPADGRRLSVDTFWPWQSRDYLELGDVSVYSRVPQRELRIEPDHLSGARVSNGIELVGYTFDVVDTRPDGSIGLTLIWHVTGPIESDYSVFCHLTDDDGKIWGQADGVPVEGAMPTTAWMAGEYVMDQYVIPIRADAPAGDYQLWVGMYDPATEQRPGEPADLGTITLSP